MYICIWNKLGEYGITSWSHEEHTNGYKCNITVGVIGHVVHAGQTSDSPGRSII